MEMNRSEPILHGYAATMFVAVQKCTVPLSRKLTDEQQQESLRIVNDFLSRQPFLGTQLKLFLLSIDTLSILTGGRRFSKLTPEKQVLILNRLFDSSIPLFRKGFWGLNTLTRLGVYGQPSLHAHIGYRLRPVPDDRKAS